MNDVERIDMIRSKLDEWHDRRYAHDVPGQGDADMTSIANLLADILDYLYDRRAIEDAEQRERAMP